MKKEVCAVPEKDVGYLIKNLNDKLKVKADADLKRYDLTLTQSRVMAFLYSRGGQATQKEIELFLEVSHPTVVGVVSRMEQNGYLVCWTGEDRRNKNVRFTRKAEEIGTDMERHIAENEKRLLSPLSAEEADTLKNLLWRIYNNLD